MKLTKTQERIREINELLASRKLDCKGEGVALIEELKSLQLKRLSEMEEVGGRIRE